MIKVLQIGMTRNIGGLETYLMQQFRHLDRSKIIYDFVNITSEYEIAFADEILSSGSKIFGVVSRHRSPIKHYWQWLKLLWSTRGQYRAIVLNSNGLSYVFPIFAAKFFGVPMRIMHSHNSGFEINISLARRILIAFNKILLSLGVTDRFACSTKAGQWMFGDEKFTVINNAIDCKKFQFDPTIRAELRKKLGLEKNFVLGHVGRFTFQKNHAFLIDVFNAAVKIFPDLTLLLIGDAVEDQSFLDEARLKVKDYGLESRVKFLGLRTDVERLMQAMDCFILPSKFEGLPMVGIEAQAAGLPCLFSDAITRELEITRGLVKFISLDSIDGWIEGIRGARTIERRDTREEIAAAGYDIEREIERLEKIFLPPERQLGMRN